MSSISPTRTLQCIVLILIAGSYASARSLHQPAASLIRQQRNHASTYTRPAWQQHQWAISSYSRSLLQLESADTGSMQAVPAPAQQPGSSRQQIAAARQQYAASLLQQSMQQGTSQQQAQIAAGPQGAFAEQERLPARSPNRAQEYSSQLQAAMKGGGSELPTPSPSPAAVPFSEVVNQVRRIRRKNRQRRRTSSPAPTAVLELTAPQGTPAATLPAIQDPDRLILPEANTTAASNSTATSNSTAGLVTAGNTTAAAVTEPSPSPQLVSPSPPPPPPPFPPPPPPPVATQPLSLGATSIPGIGQVPLSTQYGTALPGATGQTIPGTTGATFPAATARTGLPVTPGLPTAQPTGFPTSQLPLPAPVVLSSPPPPLVIIRPPPPSPPPPSPPPPSPPPPSPPPPSPPPPNPPPPFPPPPFPPPPSPPAPSPADDPQQPEPGTITGPGSGVVRIIPVDDGNAIQGG